MTGAGSAGVASAVLLALPLMAALTPTGGCAPEELAILVHVPGGVDRVARVEVSVMASCDDVASPGDAPVEPLLTTDVTPGGSENLGRLSFGAYGLYGRAWDSDCTLWAAGCSPVTVNGSGDALEVTLAEIDERWCAGECEGGRCASSCDDGCLVEGTCRAPGEPNPGNACELCDPAAAAGAWTPDPGLVPDDGIDCTRDSCAGGSPSHEPDDAGCGGGLVCAPCAGGCTVLPELTVSCPDEPTDPDGAPAVCQVDLAGAPGADATECLSCGSLIGMTSLSRDDFAGCPDLASRGWIVSPDNGGTVCPEEQGVVFGPDPFAVDENFMLRWNAAIAKSVDTTGYDSVRLCFDFATYATDPMPDIAITVSIDTGTGFLDVWRLDDEGEGARYFWNWRTECIDLVAADPMAAGNENLTVRILNAVAWNIMYDNIAIDAWASTSLEWPGPVFSDQFSGCDLSGWSVDGTPTCPLTRGSHAGRAALGALSGGQSETWTIRRTGSLEDRCADVRLAFLHGTSDASWLDHTFLRFDRGEGLRAAWSSTGNTSRTNDSFLPVVVDLTRLDPAVAFAPALTVELAQSALDAPSEEGDLWIDDVVLDGARCASGDGVVSISDPAPVGEGSLAVGVSSAVPRTVHVECTWSGRRETTGRDAVVFLQSPEP